MTNTLTYTQYYERIYKTKKRPQIDWDILNPADIIDIVLDDRATNKEIANLANLAMRDHRGGTYAWLWASEEAALKVAKQGIKNLRCEDIF